MGKEPLRLMMITPVVTLLWMARYSNGITPSINSIVLLLAALFPLWITWKIFLYPQFFIPLRNLPQPPVSGLAIFFPCRRDDVGLILCSQPARSGTD